jgi:hypothetical protein
MNTNKKTKEVNRRLTPMCADKGLIAVAGAVAGRKTICVNRSLSAVAFGWLRPSLRLAKADSSVFVFLFYSCAFVSIRG